MAQRRRQNELLRSRSGKKAFNLGWLGIVLMAAVMAVNHGAFAFLIQGSALVGEQSDLDYYEYHISSHAPATAPSGEKTDASRGTQNAAANASPVAPRSTVESHGLSSIASAGATARMLCSIILAWWFLAMICQGEGLELDVQRRRYPMWEWLLSHPVPPGAVFFAEMLSPIAANPAYITAPVFFGGLYGLAYDPMLGVAGGILVGVPAAAATACAGKALEVAAMIRLPARSRGAVIGLMSWIGQASLAIVLIVLMTGWHGLYSVAHFLRPLTAIPWPWIGFVLGENGGRLSFGLGILFCTGASIAVISTSVFFTVWAIGRGISGAAAAADISPVRAGLHKVQFERTPLYRKELLWLRRDRSAIMQIFLVPLTLAGFQIYNLRFLLSSAGGAWNYLCGVAIVFGTYLLWVLGPRSLASEGPALWLALTWPQGLESLLKAKAWLWSRISSVVVLAVLVYAAYRFPADTWKIALVALGWFIFAGTMAQKAVTLVAAPNSSGEAEKIPWTRRLATSLGMLTFAIGVSTAQWQLAVVGIVYSYITAAAMWQNFRARLPYLYDPWSERLPPAPSLMHAMVAISFLVEGAAIVTLVEFFVFPRSREAIGTVRATAYAVAAVGVFIGASVFLSRRGLSQRDMWFWSGTKLKTDGMTQYVALGIAAGAVIGWFGHIYVSSLMQIPSIAEAVRHSQPQLEQIQNLRVSYAVMAIGFAPFAEEFLFRGMLFRALDREWGVWRAVLGSAVFFASYHPVLAWLPVGILGAVNAILFKKTGCLPAAVAAHTVYNAIVVLT